MSRANDGGRTHDIQDHNLALYQLSYVRRELLVYITSTRTASAGIASGDGALLSAGGARP